MSCLFDADGLRAIQQGLFAKNAVGKWRHGTSVWSSIRIHTVIKTYNSVKINNYCKCVSLCLRCWNMFCPVCVLFGNILLPRFLCVLCTWGVRSILWHMGQPVLPCWLVPCQKIFLLFNYIDCSDNWRADWLTQISHTCSTLAQLVCCTDGFIGGKIKGINANL